MASTYSPDLRIELIGSGEQSGIWGSTTNLNLGTLIEQAIAGVELITVPSSDYALISYYGAADEARNAVLVLSSAAAANVYVPPADKVYVVKNTGSYAITMYNSTVIGNTTAAGSGATVAAGSTVLLFSDSSNVNVGSVPYSGTTGTGNAVLAASPTLTGTPLAPTASPGTNTTQIATTAFVLANGVPSGAIMLWSGSTASVPSGWYLCDGNNSTPDLRDRFIVGAGSTYSVGGTGGSANAIVVSHTHTYSGTTASNGTHSHEISARDDTVGVGNSVDSASGGQVTTVTTATAGAHTHTFSGTTDSSGSSATNANLPPYYALAYIMKA